MGMTIPEEIMRRFIERTPNSRKLNETACNFLPGGDTRTTTFYGPYPAYMERGDGCVLVDSDGNEYLDFLSNYTSLVHGHAHKPTVAAIVERAGRGTVLGAPVEEQFRLAELICGRVPSVKLVRFNNSGTEATMMAMRAARAFTGKDIIIKMDGGYHGHHDFTGVNVTPDMVNADHPVPKISWPGVPACVTQAMIPAAFNSLESVERQLEANKGKVAAIITEPVLGAGGAITPAPGFLQGLRKLADSYGVLLIFDEIITFRLSVGGYQEVTGVQPDLTCFGKIIGGGLPVGAFGGREDIMAPFDPKSARNIYHGGTFCGSPITMAAGLATMRDYGAGEVSRINALGTRMANGITEVFRTAGLAGQACGYGSICQIHWTLDPIGNSRESMTASSRAGQLPRLLHLELMNRGVFSATRGMFVVSTSMGDAEVDTLMAAVGGALDVLKPYIAETAPHLLL